MTSANDPGDLDIGHPFAITVMAKAPIAGLAKTRLIPLLGASGAARAQREFVLRTLKTAQAARPAALTLSCAPDREQRFFRVLRRSADGAGLRCTSQARGDIGARMAAVFAAQADGQVGDGMAPWQRPPSMPLLLIGTDGPTLTPAHLLQAAAALAQDVDAVFIPVEDGGYLLVGLREPGAAGRLRLFEGIDWSTHRVMQQTRERLLAAGARWHELPPLWDVDEPADWLRWLRLQGTQPQHPH